MGSERVHEQSSGKTLGDAYSKAVQIAEDEYGHQEGYTGQINSTCGVTDLTQEYKNSKLSENEFIEKYLDDNSKHSPVGAICVRKPIANKNTIKTQVEHIVTPGTKRWVLKYVVYAERDNKVTSCDTKGEAVTKARAYTDKTGLETVVFMEKILDKISPMVARIKYKPSKTEREGTWTMFGHAND
jgi:hypothetical protein